MGEGNPNRASNVQLPTSNIERGKGTLIYTENIERTRRFRRGALICADENAYQKGTENAY
jgi:hypothetical protein